MKRRRPAYARRRAYNFPDVTMIFSFRARGLRRIFAGTVLTSFFAVFAAAGATGQAAASSGNDSGAGESSTAGAKVLLVLPFDNRTGLPNLEWIREAAADVLSARFAAAGFQPTSRADR